MDPAVFLINTIELNLSERLDLDAPGRRLTRRLTHCDAFPALPVVIPDIHRRCSHNLPRPSGDMQHCSGNLARPSVDIPHCSGNLARASRRAFCTKLAPFPSPETKITEKPKRHVHHRPIEVRRKLLPLGHRQQLPADERDHRRHAPASLEAWRIGPGAMPELPLTADPATTAIIIPATITFTPGGLYQLWLVGINSKGRSLPGPVQNWTAV